MTSSKEIEVLRSIPLHKIFGVSNNGRRITLRCPLHKERTPSFVLYPEGSWHCYGCDKTGQNSIDFLIAMGATFPEAIEELKKYID